jgi:hypothetical protein
MQLPGFKNAEGAAGNSALCGPGAGLEFYYPDQGSGPKPQAASNKLEKSI